MKTEIEIINQMIKDIEAKSPHWLLARCRTLEKENASLKKEVEELLSQRLKLTNFLLSDAFLLPHDSDKEK